MEVAILGGLALAGWFFKPRDRADDPPPSPTDPVPAPRDLVGATPGSEFNSTDEILRYNTGAIKRFQQAQFPERTGVIAPFFRDVRSQHTNPVTKQRTLETFTGNDVTWKPKREAERRFNPTPQDIDSSGRPGNTPNYIKDQEMFRDSLTNVQSGTFPFQRENVGRGLGIGANEAAADNFHPMLQIVPPDGNSHKHHEMPGRLSTTGASVNQERAFKPAIRHNRPPRVYTQDRYPMAKGRAAITAPTHRAEHTSVAPPCHLDTEHRVGVAYREGGMPIAAQMTRTDDRTTAIEPTNLVGPDAPGAYVGAHFDPAKFDSLDRETQGQILNAKYFNPAITKYSQDAPNQTIRDVTGSRFGGPARIEPVVKGGTNYCQGLQMLKEAKRGSYVESKHTPGAQRTEAYRQANLGLGTDPYIRQTHKLRCQMQQRPGQAHGNSSATRFASTVDQVGQSASNGKKIPGESNPRNDFGLAARVLHTNPYTIGTSA